MFVSKSLATKYPRGVLLITEFDLFYPLPVKVSDWQFKKPPPVPLHLKKTTFSNEYDYNVDRPGEIRVSALSNNNPSTVYQQNPNYYNYVYTKN